MFENIPDLLFYEEGLVFSAIVIAAPILVRLAALETARVTWSVVIAVAVVIIVVIIIVFFCKRDF